MNGFSSADMSTAASNGHRDGYQAGYADAVKAVEAGKDAAAQEAVAVVSAETFNSDGTSDIIKPALPIGTKLYAAPVAAAPVDAGQITGWRNVDGISVFTVASHSGIAPDQEFVRYDDHLKALESTPAAPGIDLEQFREAVENLEWQNRGHANPDFPTGDPKKHAECLRLLALIDDSSKGGSDAHGLKLPSLPFAVFDEFGDGADDRVADYGRACATAAMQATSAEVGA